MANLESKKAVAEEIKEKVDKAVSIVLLDYNGIDAEKETALRKHLTENNIDYKVYKNTTIRFAVDGTKFDEVKKDLEGPTAVAFSYDDPTAAARSLYDIVKDCDALELKSGVVEGTYYDKEGIKKIACIPSKEVLLSKLLGSMKSPISSFARVIKQIAEKQEA
ncbi:MAG: 50S ribosomal protein L10 [Clostridia bacterium]|nr:50S ribosomal protein L10 [Clostridia bacterium]